MNNNYRNKRNRQSDSGGSFISKIFKIGCVILVLAIVVVGFLGFQFYNNYQYQVTNTDGSDELVKVEVPAGSTPDEIGQILLDSGVIEDLTSYEIYLRLNDKGDNFKAGVYEFRQNQSLIEVTEEIAEGAVAKGIRITFPEGFTKSQIIDRTVANFAEVEDSQISAAEMKNIIDNPDSVEFSEEISEFLNEYKPDGKPLEGFLYPDTYEFPKDANAEVVISEMLANFVEKSAQFGEPTIPGLSFYESLVLASIVEKESLTNEEKPSIASVFANRLEIGMLLQSDATVNYATQDNNPRPTYQDLQIDSPYNTYKYSGLPPTPITNPRTESIEAALDPAETDYYYFIHEQDGSGQVHFARTDTEHYQNVRTYLD
jgi:UPF0755 protein